MYRVHYMYLAYIFFGLNNRPRIYEWPTCVPAMKGVSRLHHDIELQKVDPVCALHVDAYGCSTDTERERERHDPLRA